MEIIVGTSAQCDYRVEEEFVSRRHCRVVMDEGRYLVEDLGSTNGTFVCGQRLRAGNQAEVAFGAEVVLAGEHVLDWGRILSLTAVRTETAAEVGRLEDARISRTPNRFARAAAGVLLIPLYSVGSVMVTLHERSLGLGVLVFVFGIGTWLYWVFESPKPRK